MGSKPYEVIAVCAMPGLPGAGDIGSLGTRLEQARGRHPAVVRAAPQPPAAFRDGGYVLETRLLAWAEDGEGAVRAATGVLEAASVSWRDVYLSGRALNEADVPRPGGRTPAAAAVKSRGRGAAAKTGAAARKTRRPKPTATKARATSRAAGRKPSSASGRRSTRRDSAGRRAASRGRRRRG